LCDLGRPYDRLAEATRPANCPIGSSCPARQRQDGPAGKIELGAIHTYIELFARYFVDLTPHFALIAALQADRNGNLYTGPNTEDTPTVEATAFESGIVVAQVNERNDRWLRRNSRPIRPSRTPSTALASHLQSDRVARNGGRDRNRTCDPALYPRLTETK
jgi:hypothetical protein